MYLSLKSTNILYVCVLVLQVLFLGPLTQLAMDCPWSFMDGVKVACGETWGLTLNYTTHTHVYTHTHTVSLVYGKTWL